MLRSTVMATLLLALGSTSAEAQLGKLRKMGAAAIKDAAKEKLGTDKKEAVAGGVAEAAGGRKEASMPALTEEHITLVVASLTPQVKAAEARAAAAAARRAFADREKATSECMTLAEKNYDPMKGSATMEKNSARISALQKQSEAVLERLNAASKADDRRAYFFLADTSRVLMQRTTALTLGASCTVDFTPAAILEERFAATQPRPSSSGSDSGFDPGPEVRQAMSSGQYGLLRERLALWTLLQENPALQDVGKEGVFTPAEQAALTARAADIRTLAPLFKREALIWKTWDDLRSW